MGEQRGRTNGRVSYFFLLVGTIDETCNHFLLERGGGREGGFSYLKTAVI